jgi:hypothetical protein
MAKRKTSKKSIKRSTATPSTAQASAAKSTKPKASAPKPKAKPKPTPKPKRTPKAKPAPPSPHILIRKSAGPRAFAKYKAYVSGTRWELAISGRWSESPYHSGHIAYYVRRIAGGVWLMKSVERNADLDDVTEEDIEEGALNDDQLQALWGRTLEEAQNEEFVEIVAAWLDAPRKTVTIDAAKTLYEALRTHDAIMVSEPDDDGLLEE